MTGSEVILDDVEGGAKLIATCPHLEVDMGGVKVPSLIDTGSTVSTVTESFFLTHFQPWGHEKFQACHWLQLRAANGLAIPYIGYLELDVKLCGKFMAHCGLLVVKDPPGGAPHIPCVLGMNLIRRCYRELFVEHGLTLFGLSSVSEAPTPVLEAEVPSSQRADLKE